jgi:hypothetical protein
MTTVLEKQVQKECDLRNRELPPFVSDYTDPPLSGVSFLRFRVVIESMPSITIGIDLASDAVSAELPGSVFCSWFRGIGQPGNGLTVGAGTKLSTSLLELTEGPVRKRLPLTEQMCMLWNLVWVERCLPAEFQVPRISEPPSLGQVNKVACA